MKILKILLFLLVFNSFVLVGYLFYQQTGYSIMEKTEIMNISRVVDGDTFISGSGDRVRLLSINTPEKGQLYYSEAINFLRLYENMTLKVEYSEEDIDKYGRKLRYLFYNQIFINKEILKAGLANIFYYKRDKYTQELEKAEKQARDIELGIWKRSDSYGCIELVDLKYEEEERCKNQEQLILNNKCDKLDIVIKDDATHIYDVSLENGIMIMNFSCIWNDRGDSVYIWDDEGLVLFYRY